MSRRPVVLFPVALAAALAIALATLGAGCGQKGPLYLPDTPAPAETAPSETPADDGSDDERDGGRE